MDHDHAECDGNISAVSGDPSPLPPSIASRGASALALLVEASHYANQLDAEAWDFAVEIDQLRERGLTHNDFRWMSTVGLLDHAEEVPRMEGDRRSFQSPDGLRFSANTCFLLTPHGLLVAEQALSGVLADSTSLTASRKLSLFSQSNDSHPATVPYWDEDDQELRVAGVVVKRFSHAPVDQRKIIVAFDDHGWPSRIDDPLPTRAGNDSRVRLSQAIGALNHNQRNNLLEFSVENPGTGVRWQLRQPGG